MSVPYKYRGALLLLLLMIFLPFVAWHYALSDSFTAWRECCNIERKLEQMPQYDHEQTIAQTDEREVLLSGELLDSVKRAVEINRVKITGYEPRITMEQDGVTTHTAQLLLTGEFCSVLRVVDLIEQQSQCRLRSLAWRSAVELQSRRMQLTATLYIEQIIFKE